MVKKCCVTGCDGNYTDNTKASVYRFPQDPAEKERWRRAIPRDNIPESKDTVICEAHWPTNFERTHVRGKIRPVNPPSIFDGVPSSMVPTPPPKPRSTIKACSSSRNIIPDELSSFLEKDKVNFTILRDELINNSLQRFVVPITNFMTNDVLFLQSQHFNYGIPLFLVKIYDNLRFETYHFGVRCHVSSLSKNYMTKIDTWSKLEECIRFLNNKEFDNKKRIIEEQMAVMAPVTVGSQLYGPGIIVRAFEYFATSRALYNRLRKDYQLPSITTLTRITSKVSKIPENTFLNSIFKSLENNQKLCVVLHDEVYVKKMLLYHGGTVFGRSVDNPTSLARTVLGIMVICLYGGPKFLSKMLPVSKLSSKFLLDQVTYTTQAVSSGGGNVIAIISDGNRTNQAFFNRQKTIPEKPWLTEDGKFLLFDNPHILKCIRNLWLTEKTGELDYNDSGVIRTAKWSHLRKLFALENGEIVKMSHLDEVSVYPKPIERQKVTTCLKVFCEETYNALLIHPGMSELENAFDTATFIKKVLTWWTIINVKGLGADVRHRNTLEGVIKDPRDTRLDYLLQFGEMCLKMMPEKQGERKKQLSKDTAMSIHHTCNGMVELCRYLLSTSHEYVCFGQFTTDFLEKEFSKLRQGSGGTYFISVQQVLEKLYIKQSSLLLSKEIDINEFNLESGHNCASCSYLLCEEGSEIFDNLPTLESSVPSETKMSLIYIAGYVTRNDPGASEIMLLENTTFYHQNYGKLIDSIDRGGLNIPTDCSCQWSIFCFILFNTIKAKVCRKSLCNIFMLISEYYSFNMEKKHGLILSNIFLNNYCTVTTPRSGKEPAVKILKLS